MSPNTPVFWNGLLACIIAAGCIVLLALGHNSMIQAIFVAIVLSKLGIDIAIQRKKKP